MTLLEKFAKIMNSENDKELYEGIEKLTDKQKDILIASLVKATKGTNVALNIWRNQ